MKTGTVLGKLGTQATQPRPTSILVSLIDPMSSLETASLFVIDKLTITATLKADEELGHVSIEPKTVAVKDAYPLVLEIVTYH